MPIYTGKSADGSDMREAEGVYINPNNPDEWSNQMYPEQAKEHRTYLEVFNYMDGKYTLNDVYKQILEKSCLLNKRCRDYVLSYYDETGKFIVDGV